MNAVFRHIIFFQFLATLTFSGYAQSQMRFTANQTKQKVRFEFVNNLIIIPLEINGIELSFILDSGASKTIIFGASGDSIPFKNKRSVLLRGMGTGKPTKGVVSKHNRIRLKNSIIGFNQTLYIVESLKFNMSSRMGKTIHGIIGYDLLKNFVTYINYNKKRIIFYNPEFFKPPRSKKYNQFDIEIHNNKPYVDAQATLINDTIYNTKLLIDSGNSDAIWLFEDYEKGFVVSDNYFTDNIGEGLSGSIMGKRSKLESFNLGDYVFEQPTVTFLDSTTTTYANLVSKRRGSIGSRVLKRFKVIIDYPNKKLYLKKSRSFKDEFRYNRVGIEIAFMGTSIVQTEHIQSTRDTASQNSDGNNNINFEIVYEYEFKPLFGIYKIRSGSPADIAGLKENDLLYKINGKPAYLFEYGDIISLFYGDDGEKLTLVVDRNSRLFQYELRLKKMF